MVALSNKEDRASITQKYTEARRDSFFWKSWQQGRFRERILGTGKGNRACRLLKEVTRIYHILELQVVQDGWSLAW